MINIIFYAVRNNDNGKIKSLEVKLKASPEEAVNENTHNLVARVSATFYSLKLYSENGESVRMSTRARNIVDINIRFVDENILSDEVISSFISNFRKALNHSPF